MIPLGKADQERQRREERRRRSAGWRGGDLDILRASITCEGRARRVTRRRARNGRGEGWRRHRGPRGGRWT